jgi:DNA-binding SARP family transcriptional activator
MATEFLLLGPLAVGTEGAPLPIPGAKHRAVLAALLLRANEVVTVDDLAEVLWGEDLPSSARTVVQNYVMRLRRALGPAGSRITTQPGGYLIRVEPGELDLDRLEDLLRHARAAARQARWTDASAQGAAALALWRGEPLADVGSDLLAARHGSRLAELRLQALESRLDAELQLERHGEAISELRQLAAGHPLRERLHALLMLALYRDGRQAEALAAYQHARDVLIAELGAEPGPDLQQLHQQILAADPALNRRSTSSSATAPAAPVPRQLPAGVAGFTGRAAELGALTEMLDHAGAGGPGTVVITAIGGTAGVGKTALVLHWAHQVSGRFPDGQLHVDLRGFDPSGTPVTPDAAIRSFLDALGVPPERIPASPEAQAGLYRSLLACKCMLIVLDNARDEQQVRPLLPASPGSQVIVTSRNQLSGLVAGSGARLLTLDVLSHAEAAQLLTARLGSDRAGAETAAVDRIAGLCACLPLALAVTAARAAARPGFPLAGLAAELADSGGRLDALDAGDPTTSVRVVFSWSYRQLGAATARMFRLLGLHPGPDICVPAAASLAAHTQPQARRLLDELARAHLITEHAPGRYAFHDLLRAYAADKAGACDSDADRDAAVGRVLDHYLHTAFRASMFLDPRREPISVAAPGPGTTPGRPAGCQQALAWFAAEHNVLLAVTTLAVESGSDTHAWQLPWTMTPFLHRRGLYQDWAATQRLAVAAAARLGDIAGQAVSSRHLAHACRYFGEYDQVLRCYSNALALYRQLGNRAGEAAVHRGLGLAARGQGRYADALSHAEESLRLYRAADDKHGEAVMLNNVGWYHALLGDYQQTRAFCQRSLIVNAEVGDRALEGNIWDSLGYAEHHLGNLAEAVVGSQRALSIAMELGDRAGEAVALTHLGDAHRDGGGLPRAREAWQQALAILDDLRHPDADTVRAKLATPNDQASEDPSA